MERKLVKSIAMVLVAGGLLPLLGYWIEASFLYRPIADGPSSHPFTCLMFVMLGVALCTHNQKGISSLVPLILACTGLLVSVLTNGLVMQGGIMEAITPFRQSLATFESIGRGVRVSSNTSFMLMALFFSLICISINKRKLAQLPAVFATFIPLLSLFGYVLALGDFYGQMSLLTTSLGIMAGVAFLVQLSNVGFIGVLFHPSFNGQVARRQFFLTMLCLVVISIVFFKLAFSVDGNVIGVFFTFGYWLAFGLVWFTSLSLRNLNENQLLSIFVDAMPNGSCVIDRHHKIIRTNQLFADMLGYSVNDMLKLHVWDWDLDFNKNRVEEEFPDVSKTKATLKSQHKRKNGEVYIAEIIAAGTIIAGEPLVLCQVRDITENERIRNEMEEFKSIVDKANDCVFIFKPDTLQFVYANRGAERQVGYSRDELYHMRPYDIKPRFNENQFRQFIAPLLAKEVDVLNFETLHRHKNGKDFDVNVNLQLVESEPGSEHFIAIVRDITAHKRQQEKERQSQKMEAIGRLAGGIAHDFNNQLTTIRGFSELIEKKETSLTLKNYARKVIEAADESAKLTGKLLTFSRKDTLHLEHIDIHELINEVVDILYHSVDKKININTELGADQCVVHGDRALLKMALMNLALNARDAMPSGGDIVFYTASKTLNHDDVSDKGQPHFESKILIRVKDTGAGISPENKGSIFEPFFTTKPQGEGTGLGLASVAGAIAQHGGSIAVDSEPGKGTVFEIELPVSFAKQGKPESEQKFSSEEPLLKRKVLVADDEPLIMDLYDEYLSSAGHEAIFAKNGAEAVELFRQHHNEIDVVFLDVVMPAMDGREAFLKIKEIDSSAKILFVSGYMADSSIPHLLALGALDIIEKPFSLTSLNSALQRAMDD
ncbi:PAS domain S-box protein [Lacimicrobium sp. SS2-24]|uniref:PAS domain S-box protein n=1 Tax=Lacimicrobium sp. SS2-24 TaxID=2005569 RepID=UPI001438B027|nr:PAS domain S-box protein [Lacimicrobium sp. SS2-24]